MLIRAELEGTNHEWGWECDFVPSVGDELWLYIGVPDEEPDGDHLTVIVAKRVVPLESSGTPEVWLTVRCDAKSHLQDMPDGYIAHSPEWPSTEHSARERRHALACKRILAGLLPED